MKKSALIISLIAASLTLTGCKDDLKAPQVKDWSHPMGMNIDSATETRMFKEKYCSGDAEIVNSDICPRARAEYACWRTGGAACTEKQLNYLVGGNKSSKGKDVSW